MKRYESLVITERVSNKINALLIKILRKTEDIQKFIRMGNNT